MRSSTVSEDAKVLKSRDYRLEGLEWLYSESQVVPMEEEVLGLILFISLTLYQSEFRWLVNWSRRLRGMCRALRSKNAGNNARTCIYGAIAAARFPPSKSP